MKHLNIVFCFKNKNKIFNIEIDSTTSHNIFFSNNQKNHLSEKLSKEFYCFYWKIKPDWSKFWNMSIKYCQLFFYLKYLIKELNFLKTSSLD